MREANPQLSDLTPGGQEAAIRAGLDAIGARVLSRTWKREDGAEMRIRQSFVDANWGQQTDTVYEWCRRCPQQPMPSHGKYLGATTSLWTDRRPEKGERSGLRWRVPNPRVSKRSQLHILYDTNFWKSFVVSRASVPVGGQGGMELFGTVKDHALLFQHWLSENPILVSASNRTVIEWKLPQNNPDNHWWDCIVGACVAASFCDVCEQKYGEKKARVQMSLSEMQARAVPAGGRR